MSPLGKLFGKKEQRTYAASMLSGAWEDLGASTAERRTIKRPINITRSMLQSPVCLSREDSIVVTLNNFRNANGEIVPRVETPPFVATQAIAVDSVTRFEVIDEFGVDVGIGFVLGQTKR